MVILTMTMTSCTEETGEEGDTPALEAGYASGKVVDTQGNPIAGATVFVDNTIFFNSGISTTTDAQGNYKIKTPIGSWRTYACIERDYNGAHFIINLHPDNADRFAGEDGAVRNFQWKLSGENPMNPGTYYGGLVNIYKDPDSELYDVENVEFTFTPVGPRIDGSTGESFTLKCGAPYTEFYSIIPDVPIGRYELTAMHAPKNTPLKVRNGMGDDAYQNAVTIDFYGDSAPRACNNCMYVEYSEL